MTEHSDTPVRSDIGVELITDDVGFIQLQPIETTIVTTSIDDDVGVTTFTSSSSNNYTSAW